MESSVARLCQLCGEKDPASLDTVIGLLKEIPPGEVNQSGPDGRTPLHHTLLHRYHDDHLPFLTALLDHGANPFTALGDRSPVEVVCEEAWVNTARLLIHKERDVAGCGDRNPRWGRLLFHTQARKYDLEKSRKNSYPAYPMMPSMRGRAMGNKQASRKPIEPTVLTEICELLIENGADVNTMCVPQEGISRMEKSAIHLACHHGDLHLLRKLLDNGASGTIPDQEGASPLHHACAAADLECVNAILEVGGDATAVDRKNATCLHYLFLPMVAIIGDNVKITDILLRLGADIHKVSEHKHSAFEYSMTVGANHYDASFSWNTFHGICGLQHFPIPRDSDMTRIFGQQHNTSYHGWLREAQLIAVNLQAGFDNIEQYALSCARFETNIHRSAAHNSHPNDIKLMMADLIELGSWICPDSNVFSQVVGDERRTFRRDFKYHETFQFSSLRKWCACVIRKHILLVNGRYSVLPVINHLAGKIPNTFLHLLSLEQQTAAVLKLK